MLAAFLSQHSASKRKLAAVIFTGMIGWSAGSGPAGAETKLKPELAAKGRLAWHQESCARLIADSTRERVPDMDSLWRVKGSHALGRRLLWRRILG